MRTLGRILGFGLLAALVIAAGWQLWSRLAHSDAFARYAGANDLVRSTTYEVTTGDWLEFPLPNANGVRVLSTALVGVDESLLVDERWGYALSYQLLGRGGKVLKEWNYHYRTGITRRVDADTGRFEPGSYVAGLQAVPADSRATQINAMELDGATRLRVRLLDHHPGLQHVLVRCYARERVAEQKLAFLWQRMDVTKRERVARGSVFGAELLREQEQYNLLRWEWAPVGPAGVQDEDYRSHVLFILNEGLGETVDESVLPEGLYSDRLSRGMLAIPEGEWGLRLEVHALDSAGKAANRQPVQVRWYGSGGLDQWAVSLDYDSDTPYLRNSVTAGLLEVVSEHPVIVRVYLSGNGQSFMHRAEPDYLRGYLTGDGEPVLYAIEHVAQTPTPFRIDLRGLWQEGEALLRTVHYQLLDHNGRELASGDIDVDMPLSLYDRVTDQFAGERVTDAVRRYFYLPDTVASVRLSASAPVVVAAYSRPDDLQRHVRVPEDYRDAGWDPAQQPAWFMVRPTDHETLRLQQRSVQIVLQSRPPEPDPQILAGRYEWKEYQPRGKWLARQLLVPRSMEQAVPDRSRAGVFAAVPANRPLKLRLLGQAGRQQVAPTLVHVGSSPEAADLKVSVDGEVVVATRLFSPRTRLRLPLLAVGEHSLHIATGARGSWWINYTEVEAEGRLLRDAVRLDDRMLQFDYVKQEGEHEVLSGELYCEQPGRVALRATIDAVRAADLRPRLDWTFLQRSFDLHIDGQQSVPVMDTPDRSVSPGQAFFLPLGEDLAGGPYRISLDTPSTQSCYVNVHRLIAGQPVLRRFFRENDLAAAGDLQ